MQVTNKVIVGYHGLGIILTPENEWEYSFLLLFKDQTENKEVYFENLTPMDEFPSLFIE